MSWSLSKWGTYQQCALKYKLKYIDGLPSPPSRQASRGLTIHSAVENLLNGSENPLPPEISYYEQFLKGIRQHGRAELKLAVNRNWEPVDWKADDAWLRSVLDFLIPTSPQIVLYDWKTGREYDDHYDQKELYSTVALAFYAEATEAKAVHVYLDHGKNTERTYHRDQTNAVRDKWNERVSRMEADADFIPSPGYYCRYCPYSKVVGGPCQF